MANPILQLLEALRNMFTCDIGIDLGTANTLVYMKGRGIIIREPSVVAVDARTDELRVRCVGHEAKAIIGAAPNSILAVRPLKDGVIADFDITAAMLQSFIPPGMRQPPVRAAARGHLRAVRRDRSGTPRRAPGRRQSRCSSGNGDRRADGRRHWCRAADR